MELTKNTPRIELFRIALEKGLIPAMKADVAEVFNCLNSKSVNDCTDVEIQNAVNDGITKAHLIMGLNVKGESSEAVNERVVLVKMISEDIRKYWGSFGINEVILFFEWMAKGFLGDYKIMSPQNVMKAMMDYSHVEPRRSALAYFIGMKDKILNPKVMLSEEQKDMIVKEKIVKRFNEFEVALRMNASLEMVKDGFVDYDYLEQKKYIQFDDETKKVFWAKAIDWVEKMKRDNLSQERASEITKHVVSMVQKEGKNFTITIAKEMLLCNAYKKLIFKGRNISDIINAG